MRATRINENQWNYSVPSPPLGSSNTIVCTFAISFDQSSLKGGYVLLISSAVKLYGSVSVDSSILAKNLTKLNKDLVPKFEAGCDDGKRIVPRIWIFIKRINYDSEYLDTIEQFVGREQL